MGSFISCCAHIVLLNTKKAIPPLSPFWLSQLTAHRVDRNFFYAMTTRKTELTLTLPKWMVAEIQTCAKVHSIVEVSRW